MRRRRDWPAPGPERAAFGALLARQCILSANALSFLPDPAAVMRAGALADVACRARKEPAPLRCIIGAWGSTSLGHPRLARWFAHRAREPRHPAMPPRNAALLATGRTAMRVTLGDWAGLAAALDEVAAQWQKLGAGRQEMEVRSLGAKLAFYEGRLAEAWDRFAQMSELAMQRPGESWRAWGPLGQCEVGLCLPGIDESLLQRLLERATQLLSEMENVDAAYVLRRHGVAARLAWRRGDIEAAREAVRAGAAAAARAPRFGFWAQEGLASLGDVLALLRVEAQARHEPPGLLDAAWAALAPALDAHVKRFPPAASMCARVGGLQAVAGQRTDAGRRLLEQAVALADRQGARVDLARALEALGTVQPGAVDDAAPARRAERLWQSMGAAAVPRLRA